MADIQELQEIKKDAILVNKNMANYEYYNAMDRGPDLPINQIGASTNPFQHQTEALKARIFHGASRIEFSFFGQQKSNKEQPSPEAFGKRERQDMRDLAEYNKVQTSTHATVGINGLSGLNQGRFSDEQRKNSIDELKRAIDFAADATTGGAVVFHTGEAPRSMHTSFGGEFQMHKDEPGREQHYIASRRQKALVSEIRENSKQYLPVKKLDSYGNPIIIKDENGKEIFDNLTGEYLYEYEKDDKGGIKLEENYFKQYKLEHLDEKHHVLTSEEKNELRKIKDKELTENDKIALLSKIEQNVINRTKNQFDPDFFRKESKEAAIDFHKRQTLMQIQYQLGMSRSHEQRYEKELEDYEKIKKSLKYYKELKEKLPPEEYEKMKEQRPAGIFIPPDEYDPVKYLEKILRNTESELEVTMDMVKSGKGRALEIMSDFKEMNTLHNGKQKDFIAAEEFAAERATESMSEAAMFALEKTEQRIRQDKEQYGKSSLEKNPLYISPESWQPESYGGHPDEMKKLVLDARKKFTEELERVRGYSHKKAEETAEKHIKATVDIGHLNTWKRYYVKKENESQENYDKRFKDWVLKKTEDLVKNKIVGHVHLSDNYGYHDEHLTIGDGNAPIKEFLKIMKKGGIDEFIVEGGSFNPLSALPDAWRFLGSPVYSVFKPGLVDQTWSDALLTQGKGFHQSYFGRTENPRYIIGEYAPSEDYKGSPFYTGTPLE